jgi:hypothetical protein
MFDESRAIRQGSFLEVFPHTIHIHYESYNIFRLSPVLTVYLSVIRYNS